MSDLQVRGPLPGATGTSVPFRADVTGAQVVTDGHGRFTEAALRGTLFSGGMTTTSISNSTFTTGTLTASCTPIIGLWNPVNSGKNLVVLQVRVQFIVTALNRTGGGGFVWAVSTGQSAISTGITALSRLSLANSGGVGKVYANTALTGLSGSLVVQEAAGVQGGPMPVSGTDVLGVVPYHAAAVDNVDGGMILAPGAVIALLATTTPVGLSAASSILWEEVPQLS